MHADITVSALFAFLLVLARIGGALVFVPIPCLKNAPEAVRAALVLAITIALYGQWPVIDATEVSFSRLIVWVASEAAIGIAIGVCLAIMLEVFAQTAQACGLQAGYAYASTIDPATQADAGILLVLSQLISGMLFFALGFDRDLLRLFAETLIRIPPGAASFHAGSAEIVIRFGSTIFSAGMRLAMPVVSLLILVDVSLALLGRINAQLQLLTLAFPVKMLAALMVLSWVAAMFPRVLHDLGAQTWANARGVLGL